MSNGLKAPFVAGAFHDPGGSASTSENDSERTGTRGSRAFSVDPGWGAKRPLAPNVIVGDVERATPCARAKPPDGGEKTVSENQSIRSRESTRTSEICEVRVDRCVDEGATSPLLRDRRSEPT